MTVQPVFIDGQWREADGTSTFRAENPAKCEPLADEYPISSWKDCDSALRAATAAFEVMRGMPGDDIARFLDAYASRIEGREDELVQAANSVGFNSALGAVLPT